MLAGREGAVKLLLKHGANIEAKVGKDSGSNVLFKAMEGAKASGEPGSNALIARESAEMNVRKVVGCIKLLLDAGLQRIIEGNRPAMVSASLPYGATPNWRCLSVCLGARYRSRG